MIKACFAERRIVTGQGLYWLRQRMRLWYAQKKPVTSKTMLQAVKLLCLQSYSNCKKLY